MSRLSIFPFSTRLVFALVLLSGLLLVAACEDEDEPDGDGTPAPTATDGDSISGQSVDVIGIWGADELPKFEAMAQPWEGETGASVNFTGTRDITAILTTRVEGGNPPAIAIPAEVGLFQEFAEAGELVPLSACGVEDIVRAQYPDSFIELGTVNDTLYGFFMKADTKATIWYDPQTFDEGGYDPLTEASDFDDLIALSDQIMEDGLAPWTIGLEAGGASGWPGSDWIQQILLNEEGVEVYDGVIDGSIPMTDPRVKASWEKFGEIALAEGYTVQGGATGINATNVNDSSYPPFEDPPQAALLALGGFASTFISERFPNAAPGEDYDFFPFPGGLVTGGANIAYAFNDDPATCSLMRWLASADSQRIWVEQGGFTAVNENVSLDAYPDDVARNLAEQLLEVETFRFDLDDALGGATQQAIFQGVTQYLANPGQLDSILANIQATYSEALARRQ